MNVSFSGDIIQKMRLQQAKQSYIYNPQKLISTSYSQKLQYLKNKHSPYPLTYNQMIHDDKFNKKGRYKIRNTRQPNMRITERKSLTRQKANSLLGLKQLMKQQMERNSVKRRYQHALLKYADNQLVENLKFDLLFLPCTAKIPHKNRYRPNKIIQQQNSYIAVSGNRISQSKQNKIIPYALYNKMNQIQEIDYPDISRKTAGFQIKYRRHYLNKRNEHENHNKNNSQQSSMQKQKIRGHSLFMNREQQFHSLTGWQ